MIEALSEAAAGRSDIGATYAVDRARARTTAPHGLTGDEISRLSGAVHFMEKHSRRRSALWWLSTNKGTSRRVIADIWKRITRLQRHYGLPSYSALTFETRG